MMVPDGSWPAAPGGESISPPLSTQDLRSFAGNAAYAGPLRGSVDYYVPRWVETLSNNTTHAGFNWAAALFGSYWCFWRRLYALAFTILVAEFITSLLLALIVVQGLKLEPDLGTVNAVGWVALIPVRGLLGWYANTLYLSRAIQTVAVARLQHATTAQQLEFVAGRGGTSRLVLGIALAVQLAVMSAPLVPN
jgi:hypothetical protein